MNALTKSLDRSRAMVATTEATALRLKGAGLLDRLVSPAMMASPSDWQQQSRSRENYAMFRSWVYSAVHALAGNASQQAVAVGRAAKAEPEKALAGTKAGGRGGRPRARRLARPDKMTKSMAARLLRIKSADEELEVLAEHPLLDLLESPNPLQDRFQFVYSFVANLALTGRCYVVKDEDDEGNAQLYCLPTTWVRPDRSKWPRMQYFIRNPRSVMDVDLNQKPFTEDQVAVAYLPNPADPLGCMSPAGSQSPAIRVDDRIQTCQEKFFDNGIFPSVVVVVGKDPHPDVPGGVRPRLTGQQRRQVIAAIRRVMGSVANYGMPAIVDGLIEDVKPFSMNARELGWERSEPINRDRILSAFGVHPFIIGMQLDVGGYAQAAVIRSVFCDRVNMYLDLLSTLTTRFVGDEQGVLVWWEASEPVDPSLRSQEMAAARARGDVSKNENRAHLGLSPDDDAGDQEMPDMMLPAVAGMLAQAGIGQIRPEQVEAALRATGLSERTARAIAGTDLPPKEEGGGFDEGFGGLGGAPGVGGQPGEGQGDPGLPAAVGALRGAVAALRTDARKLAESIAAAAAD